MKARSNQATRRCGKGFRLNAFLEINRDRLRGMSSQEELCEVEQADGNQTVNAQAAPFADLDLILL